MQFGPSKDYPYSYPQEISEEEEKQEKEEGEGREDSKKDCQESSEKSVEKEEEAKEEKVESKAMIVKKEDDSPNSCDCSETMEEVPSPKGKEIEIKEKSGEDDKNFKSNSIKTATEKKYIIEEKHISSRFY